MKFLIVCLLAATLLTTRGIQTGTIRGQVYDTVSGERIAYAQVALINTRNWTFTDEDGNFLLDKIPIGVYDLRFSGVGYKDSVIQAIQVTPDTVITLHIRFPPYCIYDRQLDTCPVCRQKDQAIPIVYGLPGKQLIKVARKGKIRLGGCEMTGCDPHWYCLRDSLEY